MDQDDGYDWIDIVSGVAAIAHQWLSDADLGNAQTLWFLSKHGQDTFVPADPQRILDFLDKSIRTLYRIAMEICAFFCIKQKLMASATKAFCAITKEKYITEHSKMGSTFALFLFRLLISSCVVNEIYWPRGFRYLCNIPVYWMDGCMQLMEEYRALPYEVCAVETLENGVNAVKMQYKPKVDANSTIPTSARIMGQSELYCDGAVIFVEDDLNLTMHTRRPSKRPRDSDKKRTTMEIFADWTDRMRCRIFGWPREEKEQFFSGSEETDVQILGFFSPAALYQLQAVSRTTKKLIEEHFKVQLEWAKKITKMISRYFAHEYGKKHLLGAGVLLR